MDNINEVHAALPNVEEEVDMPTGPSADCERVRVTLPESPVDDEARVTRDDDRVIKEISALTLSNAAMYIVDILDKRENINKIAVEKSYSIKDGNVKTRVEIDLMCNTREIASFA